MIPVTRANMLDVFSLLTMSPYLIYYARSLHVLRECEWGKSTILVFWTSFDIPIKTQAF
jgi:hypothetical protein